MNDGINSLYSGVSTRKEDGEKIYSACVCRVKANASFNYLEGGIDATIGLDLIL
jgi:hypothetical protein